MFDIGGKIFNIQFFTSSGTYTPTKGAKTALVICVGGGGGTSSSGGTSSFGSLISCTGGGGNGGNSGTCTGGDIFNPSASRGPQNCGFFGYGNGGHATNGSSNGYSLVGADSGSGLGYGGSGGSGMKFISSLASTAVTIGGGGGGSGVAGKPGCVIVIEMK